MRDVNSSGQPGDVLLRVAIVHYWLVTMRGGEKVVEALCEMYPGADLYTHVYSPSAVTDTIRKHRVRTSFIQSLPGAERHYQKYLPLMPIASEQLDLSNYDLVLSSESGPAKGVIVPTHALHVCYCHSPMRYAWDLYHEYARQAGPLTRLLMVPVMHYLRMWDFASSARVDHFVANSRNVAQRIARHYRRGALVVHPPVDVNAFGPSAERGEYFLVVGQLVPYKRADLAVEAFNRLGKPLVVIGDGPQFGRLKKQAGPNVQMLGWQPTAVVRGYYAHCRALVFPGEEDFGMVPVECMASGRPVLAYRKGGALETVLEGVTGMFFDEQTPQSLMDAVHRFEESESVFSSEQITMYAQAYGKDRFKESMGKAIDQFMKRHFSSIGDPVNSLFPSSEHVL
jgi:glycosyltransferase involved in cell wall biosynthesis